MTHTKEFWRNITEDELAEVREEVEIHNEEVLDEYDADDIREMASRTPTSYPKTRHCSNCSGYWRIKMDFGSGCPVCGKVSFN